MSKLFKKFFKKKAAKKRFKRKGFNKTRKKTNKHNKLKKIFKLDAKTKEDDATKIDSFFIKGMSNFDEVSENSFNECFILGSDLSENLDQRFSNAQYVSINDSFYTKEKISLITKSIKNG